MSFTERTLSLPLSFSLPSLSPLSHFLSLSLSLSLPLLLVQGKLAVELEKHFTYPHKFESLLLTAQLECGFCKHQIIVEEGTVTGIEIEENVVCMYV